MPKRWREPLGLKSSPSLSNTTHSHSGASPQKLDAQARKLTRHSEQRIAAVPKGHYHCCNGLR
eukprot:2805846-Amphidinium_carterae.1